MNDDTKKNLAETLAEVLPKASQIGIITPPNNAQGLSIVHYAVPKGTEVKEIKVDLEQLLPAPRATTGAPRRWQAASTAASCVSVSGSATASGMSRYAVRPSHS